MSSRLTWHFQGHGGPVWEIAAASKAEYIKVIDPPIDPCFPGKKVVGRTYMDDGPANALVAMGEAGARIWYQKFLPMYLSRPYVHAWEGANEPPVETVTQARNLCLFDTTLANLLHGMGFKYVGRNISVGRPDVSIYPYLLEGITLIDFVGLHEYSAPTMQYLESWHCLRYKRFGAAGRAKGIKMPPFFIGECGIDGGVLGSATARRGWRSYTTEQDYMNQLVWYDRELREDTDNNVVAATVFTANPQGWDDFDVNENISRNLSTYIASQWDAPAPVDTLPALLYDAAEAHDVLAVNPDAALCKVALESNLWPTSNEFMVADNGINYVAQRFRDPRSDTVVVLFCIVGQWQDIRALTY